MKKIRRSISRDSQQQIIIGHSPNTGTLQLTFSVNINDILITTNTLLSYSTFIVHKKESIYYRSKYAMVSWMFSFKRIGALIILNLLKTDQVQVTLQLTLCQSGFSRRRTPTLPRLKSRT